MLSMMLISLFGCYDMNTLSVKPSTTTVTYGRDSGTSDKDAKNDVLTDTEKESWTIKQVFKWEQIMNGLKISFAVVAFVLVQGIGVIWYISKLDSRVDQMYKSFEEENRKDVIENQVKMKLDLQNLIADVDELSKDMKRMNQKDKEIVKTNRAIQREHQKLFDIIDNSKSKKSYSYGD